MPGRTEARAVIGREAELERLAAFVEAVPAGSAALVLDGDPGAGKTTLWERALEQARGRGWRVLVCRPAEAESSLPFAGLSDLLAPVVDARLHDLPGPQAHALDVALLRASGDALADRLAVSLAVVSVLRSVALETPVVVAVDDVQWLDAPTGNALEFAFRRLSDEPVALLATVRSESGPGQTPVVRAFAEQRLSRVTAGPLSLDAVDRLLRSRLPVPFTRPTLMRIHAVSAGNPFFALELGRALQERGDVADGPLPVPETLDELVRGRLDDLSDRVLDVLLAVAALAYPTVELVEGAVPGGSDALDEAVAAGIVRLDGDRIRFAHPLLGSAVYADAPPARRREVHRRLAELVSEQEERALHLAQAVELPDEGVAAQLESAATRAAGRGAPETAADLVAHARRLTPENRPGDATRRTLVAAGYSWAGGDGTRAHAMLEELIADLPPGADRARARILLVKIVDDIAATIDDLEAALEEVPEEGELRAEIYGMLARQRQWAGDAEGAIEAAIEAAEIAERVGATDKLAAALARRAIAEVYAGRALPGELFERGIAIEDSLPEQLGIGEGARWFYGVASLIAGDLETASVFLYEIDARAVTRAESWRAIVLNHLAELELRRGNWPLALRHAVDADEIGRQWSVGHGEATALSSRALVEAHLGDVAAARAALERAEGILRGSGYQIILRRLERVSIFLDLSVGDSTSAARRAAALLADAGVADPSAFYAAPDAVEARIAVGDDDGAERLLCDFAETGRSAARSWHVSAAARCRALLDAARGDIEEAAAAADDAVATATEPFELARALLVRGTVERRRKRKREARESLEAALETFEELGAVLWADRARGELRRTGLRHAEAGALTPTEAEVARLAASGARNKEIAQALFMSVKTVEANLSRVYGKLGVRSRTQLAGRLPGNGHTSA